MGRGDLLQGRVFRVEWSVKLVQNATETLAACEPNHLPWPAMISRDAILTELLEIESLLEDDLLNDHDRFALHGAQQALLNILEPDTWPQASQTFYRIDNRPSEAASLLLH